MKILFCGKGFKFAASILSRKIEEANKKLEGNNIELIFQDYSMDLKSQLKDIKILIPTMEEINDNVINNAPGLRLIQQFGVGLEGVDIPTATKNEIYVANAKGTNGITVAESAIFLMLALVKRLNKINESFKDKRLGFPVANELYNKTLGIIGLGDSGKELAKRARCFGMNIIAIKKTPKPELKHELGLEFLGTSEDLDYILKNADYISLHLPATKETINLLDEREFSLMNKKPFIINVARGTIINKNALENALKNNSISGVALDVFWEEPPDPNDSIYQFENVITTPHIGGTSHESVGRIADLVVHNILCVLNNQFKRLKNIQNSF
jgi:phosphoglycerate dehydrogenase-like enzyme